MFPRILQTFHRSLGVFSLGGFLVFSGVFAANSTGAILAPQTALGTGSNGSLISVSTGGLSADGTASGITFYENRDSDTSVIGDSLKGYYYDSVFGFFQLNWSSNPTSNVRFIASTSRCGSGYGYQLAGYAYGAGGLINFNYSPSFSVYYCQSDGKLHGYAYSPDIGFQNFEGIGFTIGGWAHSIPAPLSNTTNDPFFVNNSTLLLGELPEELQGTVLQGERSSTDWGMETIFYIVK